MKRTWVVLVLTAILATTLWAANPQVKQIAFQFNGADGTPVPNQAVIIQIVNPRGQATQFTTSTDANGQALINYRLPKGAPLGTYTVTATINWYNTAQSGQTTFTVVKK